MSPCNPRVAGPSTLTVSRLAGSEQEQKCAAEVQALKGQVALAKKLQNTAGADQAAKASVAAAEEAAAAATAQASALQQELEVVTTREASAVAKAQVREATYPLSRRRRLFPRLLFLGVAQAEAEQAGALSRQLEEVNAKLEQTTGRKNELESELAQQLETLQAQSTELQAADGRAKQAELALEVRETALAAEDARRAETLASIVAEKV